MASIFRIINTLFRVPFYADHRSLWVRQGFRWVEFPRGQIFAVKERSISHVVVRLRDNRRHVLNLFRFRSEDAVRLLELLKTEVNDVPGD